MIDIDTVIQNIEDKIHFLEKLKFDDDPKNFLYTPIKAVTITSSTDFKQLECQKFFRCPQSNKLVPLEKYNESVAALSDENSENLSNVQEKEVKGAVGQVSVQHKRNYRRNSIAYFEPKTHSDQKVGLAGKKRRSSTKCDTIEAPEVNNAATLLENGQKKAKVSTEYPQRSSKLITSSPLVSLPNKIAADQPQTQKRSNQAATLPAGSPKFSRSYTEFLNNLNKDMKKFKEQQKRNEPCDNFLGKDAKIFVEDPISKLVGDVKDNNVKDIEVRNSNVTDTKVTSNKMLDAVSTADKEPVGVNPSNKDLVNPKSDDQAVIESKPVAPCPESKTATTMDKLPKASIIKSPPKTILGIKAAKPKPEPSKSMFGKIIKVPPEDPSKSETKSLNKLVMRRMTIDSAWDHRSLLKMKVDRSSSPKMQPQKSRLLQQNQSDIEKSPDNVQESDSKNPVVDHQKITKLSPQQPQNSNGVNLIDPKSDKLIKPHQNMLKSLSAIKKQIPRRNSIGYGVRIDTVGDNKRLRLSQEVRKSLGRVEVLKRGQEGSKLEIKEQKVSNSSSIQNGSTLKPQPNGSSKVVKLPEHNIPTTSIDFEDELESISACHIDKLAPKGAVTEDKSGPGGTIKDNQSASRKVNSKAVMANKRVRKVKPKASVLAADDKLEEPKTIEEVASDSSPIKQKVRKHPDKRIKIIQRKLTDIPQKNNNLEQPAMTDHKVKPLPSSADKPEPKGTQPDTPCKQEQDKISNLDEVTTKTMDIIRDIEIYKNLIRQQSSDSQKSSQSVKSQAITENKQIVDEKHSAVSLDQQKMQIVGNGIGKSDLDTEVKEDHQEPQPNLQNFESDHEPKPIQQAPGSEAQEFDPQSTTIKLQPQTISSSSQSSQSSQSSDPADPNMSQPLNQLSDSQNTSNTQQTSSSEQTLGKRRRQINPKYSESEYMLKNTSREFTNAIRGKMMINKPQRTPAKKQSNQCAEKVDEAQLEEVPSTSQSTAAPQEPPANPASPEIKCKICDKTFAKPKGLVRHMPLHSEDRRYRCSTCNYRFTQRSDLTRHMLIHEGSPDIPCPKCDKKFRTEKNLQSHLETHEASLPYKCEQCEVRFRSAKNLRYHLMSHHSGVKFQCGYCGSKFADEKSLRTHVLEHEAEGEDLDGEELEDYLDFMDDEEEDLLDSDDEPMVIAE